MQKERKTESILPSTSPLVHLGTIQWYLMASTARIKPIRSQESGASPGSPTCIQENKDLSHSLLLVQTINRELKSEIEQSEHKLVPIRMPMSQVENQPKTLQHWPQGVASYLERLLKSHSQQPVISD